MTAEPLVIATTSRRGFFWVLLFIGAIGAFVTYAWIDAARNWDEFFSDRYSRVGIPIITILWLAVLSIAAKASRQVLGHHGRAVWIENGRLIFFLSVLFLGASRRDFRSIAHLRFLEMGPDPDLAQARRRA